ETYWLPSGFQWHQMSIDTSDLLYPIYFTVPLLLFRVFLETFVGIPLGFWLGYGEGRMQDHMVSHLLGGFAVDTQKKRILECFWRFFYYTSMFIYGFKILSSKSWLWNVNECWTGYPLQKIDDDIWWYNMITLTFYYSLLVPSFFDGRRRDYWQMIAHHVIAIIGFQMSFAINFVRSGSLGILSHDAADVILDGGNLLKYDKSKKAIRNSLFVVFLIW
ncbi:hypothetical protein PMAYCL1PPCAC_14900, partial [Pristionchus mayeri]